MTELRVFPITGMPEVEPGDDLADMICNAASAQGESLQTNDIVVITHKVVSKQRPNCGLDWPDGPFTMALLIPMP